VTWINVVQRSSVSSTEERNNIFGQTQSVIIPYVQCLTVFIILLCIRQYFHFWCYHLGIHIFLSISSRDSVIINRFLIGHFRLNTGKRRRSVGLSVTLVSPAKKAEPIELPFWLRTWVGPGNHVLDGGPDPPWKGAHFWGEWASHCKV